MAIFLILDFLCYGVAAVLGWKKLNAHDAASLRSSRRGEVLSKLDQAAMDVAIGLTVMLVAGGVLLAALVLWLLQCA
jgi:hypothetical protein